MTPKIIQITQTEGGPMALLNDGTLWRMISGHWCELPLPPPCTTQQTPAPSPVHNPENVPEDKLPPGRRFMTVVEQDERRKLVAEKKRSAQEDIWNWRREDWSSGYWDGSDCHSTYSVPNDFTP